MTYGTKSYLSSAAGAVCGLIAAVFGWLGGYFLGALMAVFLAGCCVGAALSYWNRRRILQEVLDSCGPGSAG